MKEGTGFVILAAGEASRMGAPKQVLPFRGKPMLLHVIEQVQEFPYSLVTGAHRKAVMSVLPADDPGLIHNPEWKSGPGSSIKAGLQALLKRHPDLNAVIILLADQPLVDQELIGQMQRTATKNPRYPVAVRYSEGAGVPALFPKSYFNLLLELDNSQGAKTILRNTNEAVSLIEAGGKARDIDTPEDYRGLEN